MMITAKPIMATIQVSRKRQPTASDRTGVSDMPDNIPGHAGEEDHQQRGEPSTLYIN